MKDTLIECVRQAGAVLLKHFGQGGPATRKENGNSIVTAADLESEKLIFDIIRRRHPEHNLLGEETGLQHFGSDFTWVIDPLDGTSNFAAALPWFGVMAAVLERGLPVLGAMYLPLTDALYVAERGRGAVCYGTSVAASRQSAVLGIPATSVAASRQSAVLRMTAERDLSDTLCAYGLDGGAAEAEAEKQTRLFRLLVSRARNVRLTNSLVDFCYTLEGRFGACINQNCKIWDIASACLMFPEAGGRFTDLQGREIRLELDPAKYMRSYAVVGGNGVLHEQVIGLAREAGF